MALFLIVFLAPLVPALSIGLLVGYARKDAEAAGSLFGIRFSARGGLAAYVISVALALLVFRSVNPVPQAYELAFLLQGSAEANEDFLKNLNSFQATLRLNNRTGLVFRNFSVDASHSRIISHVSSSRPVSGSSDVSIFPERTGSVLIKASPTQMEIADHMESMLAISSIEKDSDPLTTNNVSFSRQDWVIAFQCSIATVSSAQPLAAEEIDQLYIFKNETNGRLSFIRVPSYQIDGNIVEFEASARAIPRSLIESGLVEFRGQSPMVAANDSPELLRKLDGLIGQYRQIGTELGYFHFKDEKFISDPQRSAIFKLVSNNTLWSVGPVPEGIEPNDAVAVTTRIKFNAPVTSGLADRFGILMAYPTRIFYLAVRSNMSTLQIDPSTAVVALTERNGTMGKPGVTSLKKAIPSSFIFSDALLDRDSKIQLRWVWEKSANPN